MRMPNRAAQLGAPMGAAKYTGRPQKYVTSSTLSSKQLTLRAIPGEIRKQNDRPIAGAGTKSTPFERHIRGNLKPENADRARLVLAERTSFATLESAMQSRWLQIVERLLRPERPSRARCLEARDGFLAARRVADEARTHALAACEERINAGRRAVFAANDGFVPASMTDLEREWRRLSRRDADEGLMDLWARVTPTTWHDRKRWRSGKAGTRADLAVALASDVAGVEAAEQAAAAFREALVAWGISAGSRVAFRFLEGDADATSAVLAAPLAAARESIAMRCGAFDGPAELEREVHVVAAARLPERPLLAASVAHAALVGGLLADAGPLAGPDPIAPLCRLWLTGYVPGAIDASGIMLELPPL